MNQGEPKQKSEIIRKSKAAVCFVLILLFWNTPMTKAQ
jgi:hypothetical protein